MAIGPRNKMAYLRLALKATITFLMLWMLYSSHTAVFALGFLFCCMFGSDNSFFWPSVDLFLFLAIAMRSKYIEESFGPEEPLLDLSIIYLATFYWIINDMFRVALLGAWLPYQYLGIDRDRCWGYFTLVAMVPMFPRLGYVLYRTYQTYWPKVSAMLLCSMEVALSSSHAYIRKTIKSTFPPAPPPSHHLPTLTISPIVIVGNVEPSIKPKSAMVDSSTQTDPPETTNSSTQLEKSLSIGSSHSPEVVIRNITPASRITILPLDFETTSIRQQESSRIRKQRLRDLARRGSPTKVYSPVKSPRPLPVKSVMFTPISPPATLAAVPEPPVSPPTPIVDSTLESPPPLISPSTPMADYIVECPSPPVSLLSPTVDSTLELPSSTVSVPVATTQNIPAVPILASESATSLPVVGFGTAVASSSPGEPTSVSVPISMLVTQDGSATTTLTPELFSSPSIPEVDPILALPTLPSGPGLDEPASPPTLTSVPAAQNVSAATISELPALLPLTTLNTITAVISCGNPDPERIWLSDLLSEHESQNVSTGPSLVPLQQWPEPISELKLEPELLEPERKLELELDMAREAMEVDDIPFIETFPTLPYSTLDGDELMQDTGLVMCPLITPVIAPITPYTITSAITPATAIIPVVEDMIIDEEPVLTPESREVVMEEKDEQDQNESADNENEEEMEDVPDLPPSIPAATAPSLLTPSVTPIVLNMAPSSNAPKLDRRFIIDNAPARPACNILTLDPNYKSPRDLDASPRVKEVYVEEFEDNDGYRQKVRWVLRDLPAPDDCAVIQLELLMNEAAEEYRRDWLIHQAGIEQQEAIDLAAKKERDKEKVEAKRKARVAAFLKRQQEKREKEPSVFIQKKKTR
ncbi:hypothetical protein F4680DRAFT_467038 [Xylaria scruposa]|nr:hypothetical protein F4680DRAFT_467038 [Xylaria scruposa]